MPTDIARNGLFQSSRKSGQELSSERGQAISLLIHRRMEARMVSDTLACLVAGLIIWIVEIPCPKLSLTLNMLTVSFVIPLIIGFSFSIWTGGKIRKAIWLSAGSLLVHYLILIVRGAIFYSWQRSLEFLATTLKALGLALATDLPAVLLGCFIAFWARHLWLRTRSGR